MNKEKEVQYNEAMTMPYATPYFISDQMVFRSCY